MKQATFANEFIKDLHGQKVSVEGMDLTAYLQNPVLLFRHDRSAFSIGKVENLQKSEGKLVGTPVFDEQDPLGNLLKHKYENGFMSGFSVGTLPIGGSELTDETVERSMLLEISCVLIPANYDATLKRALQKSFEQNLTYTPNPSEQMKELQLIAKSLEVEAEPTAIVDKIHLLMKDVAEKTQTIAQKEALITHLEKSINDLEAAQEQERAELLVKGAITAKKILASEEEVYTKLALKDYDAVKTILDSKAAYEPVHSRIAIEKQEQRKDWTFTEWQKKDPAGLKEMREQQPEAYQTLLKTL